jgi:predicted Fe-Mo cluster-binding NifX family protein
MKIAVPVVNNRLNLHFGHCEKFAVLDVNPDDNSITCQADLTAPPHEPGVLPRFLAEQNVTLIIAGGMGRRAQDLFKQQNIEVIVGAPSKTPEELVSDYLSGTLEAGVNACDH